MYLGMSAVFNVILETFVWTVFQPIFNYQYYYQNAKFRLNSLISCSFNYFYLRWMLLSYCCFLTRVAKRRQNGFSGFVSKLDLNSLLLIINIGKLVLAQIMYAYVQYTSIYKYIYINVLI